MRIMTEFRPYSTEDTLGLLASTSNSSFPVANLKSIDPIKSWKSTVITESYVRYDFGSVGNHGEFVFLNRFNFSDFTLQKSNNGSTWVNVESFTGLTTDEIYDENYMHIGIIVEGSYRYLRILIPSQTPIFETSYFKIGNFLIGNPVEVWNPKGGFSVNVDNGLNLKSFKSNHIAVNKIGRARRKFSGTLEKIRFEEYLKFIRSYKPFVLSLDFDSDPTSIYLVRSLDNQSREYVYADIVTVGFNFEELV